MHSHYSQALLLVSFFLSFTSAVPTRSVTKSTATSLPAYNVDSPAPTPLHSPPPPQIHMTEDEISQIFLSHLNHDALPTSPANSTSSISEVANDMMQGLNNVKLLGIIQDDELNSGDTLYPVVQKRQLVTPRKAPTPIASSIQAGQVACIGSSSNDTAISSLFFYGGAGTTVNLCPSARIIITNAVFFYAANQTLQTQGNPVRHFLLFFSFLQLLIYFSDWIDSSNSSCNRLNSNVCSVWSCR